MKKTCISALLVVLMAGAQTVRAQESMDDVFAQLDAANASGGQSTAVTAVAPAAEINDVAPAAVEATETDAPQSMQVAQSDVIEQLLEKGVELYKANKLDESLAVFDTVLALDQFNARAVNYKRQVAVRISSKETSKEEATRLAAIAEVADAWNPEPRALASIDAPKGSSESDKLATQQLEARLKSINIPVLDFQNTSIQDVVLFLSAASRSADPAGNGVNILLLGFDSAEEDGTVTMSITDISLFDALKVITEMNSLKLELNPNAIAILPAGYVPAATLVSKSYSIVPEVGDELKSVAGDSGGGAEDLFGDSSSSSADTGPVDVSVFFSVVDFPEGSVATYQPGFNKLFVKNTPRNIEAIEDVLADLEEKAILRRSQQVEIEAKFVEFNEGALQELGFDWNVYGSGTAASMSLDPRGATTGQNNTTVTDPITGQPIHVDNNGRPGQNVFGGSALRDNTTAFSQTAKGLLGLMGGSPASMLLGNGDVDVMITAMEQDGTADILSAPKVTTKSGSEAIIRVAETHRYPQDYDVETGQRTSPVVKPQDWADFDIGVTLKVTPVVNPENNTIDLDLHPESMKFLDFEEYRVGSNGYDANLDLPLIAKMPFFRRRSVETQVTIADGSTVVMGGLVDERTETFRDQVPFLGDIPYLGRLFRSEGSRSVKKNLVIYVTARQVDASGLTSAERRLAKASSEANGAL